MTPISERLRVDKHDLGAIISIVPLHGLRHEAADTIEAMTEALVEAREQIAILQDRLGIKDTGHGTLSIIDAALALSKESNHE